MKTLKIKKLNADVKLPEYATEGAVCLDLYLPHNVTIYPRHLCKCTKIPLGVSLELPKGYCAKLHLRSSTGRDFPILLANVVGIIDNDFRGELVAFVRNLSDEPYHFEKDTRLFQLEVSKFEQVLIEQVYGEIPPSTTRGAESGSTGKKTIIRKTKEKE